MMDTMKAENHKTILGILGMLCIAAGVILHIVPHFFQRALWVDEAMVISSVCTRGLKDLVASPLDWGQSSPIGYIYILELFSRILGETKVAFRIWSLITGIGSIYMLYLLMKNRVSKHLALLFTGMYALVDRYIYYANEAKPYMSDNFFSLLVLYFWQRYKEKKMSLKWLVIAYSVIIWFSFSAVFFVAAVMIVLCFSLFKDFLKKHDKTVLKSIGLCMIVLVSFLVNFVFWLSKTSANAGEPEYWALLSIPLIPTSIAEWKWMIVFLKQFVAFLPIQVAELLVLCFGAHFIKSIRNGDDTKIYLPFVLSMVLLLIASTLGFYPIQDRLVQTHGIVLFVFAAVIFDQVEKWSAHLDGVGLVGTFIKYGSEFLLYGIVFVCVILVGKEGIKNLSPDHVYKTGYEVDGNMQYLERYLTDDDYVYVWNKSIPIYTYLNDYTYDYANVSDIEEVYEVGNTIYGQRLTYFLNQEPYSYAYELDWEAVNEDAAVITKHDSVYLFTSHGVAGMQELLDVLDASGEVKIVSEFYDTILYHYVSDL